MFTVSKAMLNTTFGGNEAFVFVGFAMPVCNCCMCCCADTGG